MEQLVHRVAHLETQVAVLTERLTQIEDANNLAKHGYAPLQRSSSFADQLQQRLPGTDGDIVGLVAYAGAVRSPVGELAWDFERTTTELLTADLDAIAPVLAALGNTVRLELVRLLLIGPRSSQELQEALDLASSGPLYYHLKELMAIGLVTQPNRNVYQIAPQRVVPFLAVLVAALDVKGG